MQKVRVYWNLHKKCWSIQSCKTNKVIDYKQYLTLENGYFVVRKGGQKRVRQSTKGWDGIDDYKKGSKNVHAFAVGYIVDDKNFIRICDSWDRVKYNPHTDDFFMHQSMSDNQWKPNEWREISKDWMGYIRLETLENDWGNHPRVHI
tara:strand:- start:267 stop:707 length:441 start_codon:yes stop_codon:yes gene_type:complete